MKRLKYIILLMVALLFITTSAVFAESAVYCASPTGTLDVHISPNKESFVTDTVYSCAEMSLIRKEGIWGLVSIDGKTGWVNMSFTREEYKEAAEATGKSSENTVQINKLVDKVALYSLPTDDEKEGSVEKYFVPAGTVLEIERETDSGWGLVPMKDSYAWIRMEHTSMYEEKVTSQSNPGIYYVYTKAKSKRGANLYSKNGGGIILKVIPNCIRLTVRKSGDNYLYTSYDGSNGWVKVSDVTSSQEDARTNVGKEVFEEYLTINDADIYNIPSSNEADCAVILGNISGGKRIFVQRITYDGWMLINNDGIVGWIPPENAEKDLAPKENIIEVLAEPETGYIASSKGEGVKLYASLYGKDYVLTVPEFLKVKTVAEKEDYLYVSCDYAAGWIKKASFKKEFEEALTLDNSEKEQGYYLKEDTFLMTLPAEEESFGSKKAEKIKKGDRIAVRKTVYTEKTQWGYVNVSGKNGWVILENARKEVPVSAKVGTVVLVLVFAGAICFVILLMRKRSVDKYGK